MRDSRRWRGPLSAAALSIIAAACGSSTDGAPASPRDGGNAVDAAIDAEPTGSGGAEGSGGGGGTGGAGGLVTAMLGAGCTLTDAATDFPSPDPVAPPDASLVTEPLDAGAHPPARDAGSSDAGGRSAAVHDAGVRDAAVPDGAFRDAAVHNGVDAAAHADAGPVKYPPLQFADIGKVAVVSNQFLFTEGPVWDPRTQALFFTDINADAVYRLKLPDTLDVFADHVGNPDGLAIDVDGNLLGAGFVSRDVWRLSGGQVHSLVDEYRGRKLNSPDDVVVRSDGTIYFTDPTFGIDGSQGFMAQAAELCFQGVYRLTGSALHLEDSTSAGPNGVNFSPDERTLYVSYSGSGQVFRFDVAPDGSLHGKAPFANVLGADSMCVDAAGDVYVASVGGITVLDPNGKQLGVIPTQFQVATNCAFGGPDQRTFFITAHAFLFGTPTTGSGSLLRIENMPIPGLPGRP